MGIAKNFKVKNGIEAGNTITAPAFVGDGSGLTNLDTADISTGILPVVRGGTGTNTSTGTGNTVLSISPTFTGTTIVPTAERDTNTTQVASTAFIIGQASGSNPLMSGSVAVGTSLRYARADHVHPIDTSRSPLAGNTSLTTVGTIGTGIWNATTIATTKGGTGLTSFNANKAIYATSTSELTSGTLPIVAGGTGSTTATGTGQTVLSTSPIFTGVPEAPTAISSTNTTQIATTAFVSTAVANAVAANVATATKLQTGRTISMSGDVSWTSSPFDGTANISGVGTLASIATAGTYRSVTINAKGLVTSGTNPTTLAGYGLTDAAPIASPVFTGNVTGLGISTGTSFNGITALSSSNPLMNGTVAIGTSTTVARADHVHASDTTKANLSGATFAGVISIIDGTQLTPGISFKDDTDTGLFRTASGSFSISCNNTSIINFTSANISIQKPLYVNSSINAQSGSFSGAITASSTTLSGNLIVSSSNAQAGGIILSDDGDIVDMNDGYCSMRFTAGVIVKSGNRTGDGRIWLRSDGQILATNNIIGYYSDERLKEKTGIIENPIEKVKSLEGFYYKENKIAKSFGFKNDNQQIALSAQDVQKVVPEAVSLAPFDMEMDEKGNCKSKSGNDYLTVDYAKMVPLLIEAIKEQQKQIEDLQKIIKG